MKNKMLLPVLAATFALSACAGAVGFVTEDRDFSGSVKDTKSEVTLKGDMLQKDISLPIDVGVLVADGRALTFGYVDSEEEIDSALAIIRKNPHITKVYNHLSLRPQGNIIDSVEDSYYTQKLWAKLVATKGVKTANYKIKVYDRIAYVLGSTTSAGERAKVEKIIDNTDGIKGKVFEVILIDRGE